MNNVHPWLLQLSWFITTEKITSTPFLLCSKSKISHEVGCCQPLVKMTVQHYMFNQGLNNMSIISVQCMPALLTLRCYQHVLRGYTNTHDTLWLQLHFLVFVYLTLTLLEILLVYKNRLEPFSLKLSDQLGINRPCSLQSQQKLLFLTSIYFWVKHTKVYLPLSFHIDP